jgi:hypothetical protein
VAGGICGVHQGVGGVLGAPSPKTLDGCGHDRGRDRLEHRGRRARHSTREGGCPRKRCGNDLDGKIAISFALGIGYLEDVVCEIPVILRDRMRIHGSKLLAGTAS